MGDLLEVRNLTCYMKAYQLIYLHSTFIYIYWEMMIYEPLHIIKKSLKPKGHMYQHLWNSQHISKGRGNQGLCSLIFLDVPPNAIRRPGALHLDILQGDIGIESQGGT